MFNIFKKSPDKEEMDKLKKKHKKLRDAAMDRLKEVSDIRELSDQALKRIAGDKKSEQSSRSV